MGAVCCLRVTVLAVHNANMAVWNEDIFAEDEHVPIPTPRADRAWRRWSAWWLCLGWLAPAYIGLVVHGLNGWAQFGLFALWVVPAAGPWLLALWWDQSAADRRRGLRGPLAQVVQRDADRRVKAKRRAA